MTDAQRIIMVEGADAANQACQARYRGDHGPLASLARAAYVREPATLGDVYRVDMTAYAALTERDAETIGLAREVCGYWPDETVGMTVEDAQGLLSGVSGYVHAGLCLLIGWVGILALVGSYLRMIVAGL